MQQELGHFFYYVLDRFSYICVIIGCIMFFFNKWFLFLKVTLGSMVKFLQLKEVVITSVAWDDMLFLNIAGLRIEGAKILLLLKNMPESAAYLLLTKMRRDSFNVVVSCLLLATVY
ncbi:hypothetical protein ACJX0J_019921, partial [Zea mays]